MFDGNRGTRDDENPPCINERYETAGNTSNLTIGGGMVPKDARSGAADVIAAAGMSDSRLGMALMRLHSEWSSASKPKRPSITVIETLAANLRKDDEQARVRYGPPNPKAARPPSVMSRAQAEAARWYSNELRLLAQRLKSRPAVMEALHTWAVIKGISPDTIGPAVHHWLDRTCRACNGLGFKRVHGQPALSARPCRDCNGGEVRRPEGATRVLNYLDDSLQKGRESLKKRLTTR